MLWPRPFSRRRHLSILAAAAVFMVCGGVLAARGLDEVAAAFRGGRYGDARQALAAASGDGGGLAEVRLWQQRLSTDPDQAIDLAMQTVRDRQSSVSLRVQAGLDGAAIALARQRPDLAWPLLKPLLDLPSADLPGDVYLLAGQALRAAGDLQRAREMLASVRPDDPAFSAARTMLGRLGLETGDVELALNYFELAERRVDPAARPDLLAGRWHALRQLGRDIEARDLAARLMRDHPGTLAAMEVFEQQRRQQEELDAPPPVETAPIDDEPMPATSPGRFAVQIAAFQDRALALQFINRWRREIPDLRLVQVADDLGQPLFRVMTGDFVSRVQAQTEARRLARAHGLEGFVTESGE